MLKEKNEEQVLQKNMRMDIGSWECNLHHHLPQLGASSLVLES